MVVTANRLAWVVEGGFAYPEGDGADVRRHFHRAAEADVEVGGRRYGVYAHDFRQVPRRNGLK